MLFDFGGVILSSPFEAFNRYEAEAGLPLDTIRGINATNPDDNAWAHFERGEHSAREFVEAFEAEARELGFEIDGTRVIASLRGVIRPAMVEALRRGDQIVTQGGVIGKVTKVVDDNEVKVEIASGTEVRVVRHTIQQVLTKTEPAS